MVHNLYLAVELLGQKGHVLIGMHGYKLAARLPTAQTVKFNHSLCTCGGSK